MDEKKRVLIVDDDQDFATLSAIRLEEAGYEVYSETEGMRVLQRVNEVRPDLVILDIMLAGVDGLNLLKNLRKAALSVPIIIITGKATMMKDVFEMEGSAGFFPKPVDTKLLVKRIKELIGNNN